MVQCHAENVIDNASAQPRTGLFIEARVNFCAHAWFEHLKVIA